jgi:hypothetical protein
VTDEEKMQMTRYGITSSSKMIYSYRQYKYENLSDALRYAERDTTRTQENPTDIPIED